MKKDEVVKLLNYLNTYYNKKFEIPDNKGKMKMMVETWEDFLGEYPYNQVKTATKKLISEKEWPPTPGEIMKQIEELKMPDEEKLSGQEAWGKIIKLIRRYGTEYGREKILENITEISRAAIDAVGGLRIIGISDENETYLMSNFVGAYESYQERKQEKQMLPGNIRKDLDKIKSRSEVEKLADNFKGNPAIEEEVRENE
jgi:uncharacterized protein (DUF2164 family)